MAKNRKTMIGPMLIIIAGCFWGSMGIFVRRLTAYGFSSIQIVSIRVTLAAVLFALVLLIKDREGFRISLRDLPLFLGLGFGSILFFTVCYFTAITMMSLSTAAILLYTSPVWIMLMSVLFFHEKLNRRKITALGLAFAGCVLVSGISGEGITPTGLLIGLGSGIGYGLYSILGTIALRKYSSYTVTAYTFMFAAAGSWIICRPADMIHKFSNASDIGFLAMFCCLTALITAVIPFLTYTLGLERVEASKAGIIATIEPMVATLVGIIAYSEPLTYMSGAGILLILSAVVILNLKPKKTFQSEQFRRGRFHNEHEIKVMTGAGFSTGKRKRPETEIAVCKPELLPEPQANDLSFTWLGHSSFFVQLGAVNILVDPVLSKRCSPVGFAGPKRFSGLPWTADELPRIDVLFLSHDHYDHLDREAICAVMERVGAIVAPLGVGDILERWGVSPEKIHALDWWESFEWEDISFTLTPSQHFSGRNPFRRNNTLWGGVYIKNGLHRIYYTGDGGYSKSFGQIRDRLGEPELMIAECGQYDPAWAHIHMFPEQTVQAGIDLNTGWLIPVHWGSFCICNHDWDDPIRRVTAAAGEAGLRIAVPRIGQTVEYENIASCNERWWEAYT